MKNKIIIYPENCFSVDHYRYKKFNDKLTDLDKEFQIFLDNKEKKEIKTKKNYYNFSINKLFRKLIFDSTNKVLKNYKMNFENKTKKFLSAERIQRYRDRKLLLLKLIRNKNNKTFNDKNTLNNISNTNNISSTLATLKEKNKNIDVKKISCYTNRSTKSYPSLKHTINISLKNEKSNGKTKLIKKININKSTIFNKINNNINNPNNIENGLGDINNNDDDNNYISINNKDFQAINKSINLKKLKLDIHKFEKSKNFLINNDVSNSIKPYQFIRKKYIKYRIQNYKTNREMNAINQSFNYRKKTCDLSQRLNESQNSLKMDNMSFNNTITARKNNTRILIQKINDINKSIKIKKRIMKKEKYINNKKIKKIIKYFKNKNNINEEIDKEIKKDIFNYQKNIGDFIFLDGKYLYTSHLSYFREGLKFI